MRIGNLLCGTAALVMVAALGWSMATAEEKPVAGESVEIPTQRGLKLVGALHRPEKPNGVAVVIAPGQGYHKDLPLIVESAKALADAGFLAVRFDWAYFTAKGQRSADLKPEMDDLEASIHFARQQEGIEKVVIAGKSLGSMVALNRAAARPDDLAGLALLTFPIHNPGATDTLFFPAGGPRQCDRADADRLRPRRAALRTGRALRVAGEDEEPARHRHRAG